MKKKKILIAIAFLCLLTTAATLSLAWLNRSSFVPPAYANANYIFYEAPPAVNEPLAGPQGLYARYCALMDASSRTVLFEKDGNVPVPMASTTKIMTCVLALELCPPDMICTVSAYAASMPDVQLNLNRGEEASLKDLLYSLMLQSHNDSAVAIAENAALFYIKNSEDVPMETRRKFADCSLAAMEESLSRELVAFFAGLMNEKARELGCEQTYFITPNGLDASDENGIHSTSAIDLCKIMAYCIKNEHFLAITGASSYAFSSSRRSYSLSNANAFLRMMDGVLSGKTGFTGDAGYCYVCALKNDGRVYVCAVLACGWPNNKTYKWKDTKKLMSFGIQNFFPHRLTNEIPLPLLLIDQEKQSYARPSLPESFDASFLMSGRENLLYEYDLTGLNALSPHLVLKIHLNGRCVSEIPARLP